MEVEEENFLKLVVWYFCEFCVIGFSDFFCDIRRLGDDLLFRVLRQSTIGAKGFYFRVRDGIGYCDPCYSHQVV